MCRSTIHHYYSDHHVMSHDPKTPRQDPKMINLE